MLRCCYYKWIPEIHDKKYRKSNNIKSLKKQFPPTGQKKILYGEVVQILRITKMLLFKLCLTSPQNWLICTGLLEPVKQLPGMLKYTVLIVYPLRYLYECMLLLLEL